MTAMDTLMQQILKILPGATFDEDSEGQVTIHTYLHLETDGRLISMDEFDAQRPLGVETGFKTIGRYGM